MVTKPSKSDKESMERFERASMREGCGDNRNERERGVND